MEESILKSTKKLLGLADAYTVFDQDVITHINAAFTILHDLGVGPAAGFYITDATPVWDDFTLLPGTEVSMSLIKNYIFLKVKLAFDPPSTSFHLTAMEKQIDQYEWRLNVAREYQLSQEVIP